MFAILSVPCSLPLPLPLHLHLYVHLWGRASPTGKGKQAGQQCGSTCDLVLATFLCPFPHHLLFPPFLPNLSPCPLTFCPSPPSPLSCAPFPSSLLYTLPLHLAPPLSIQTVLLTFFLWTSCWVIYCISFLLSLSRNGKWDHRIITTSSKVWPHTSKNLSRQQTLLRINSSKRVVSRLCGIVTEYVVSLNITFVCSVHCSQHT